MFNHAPPNVPIYLEPNYHFLITNDNANSIYGRIENRLSNVEGVRNLNITKRNENKFNVTAQFSFDWQPTPDPTIIDTSDLKVKISVYKTTIAGNYLIEVQRRNDEVIAFSTFYRFFKTQLEARVLENKEENKETNHKAISS